MSSSTTPRAEGFYWVRLTCAEGLPVVAEWRFGVWLFASTGEPIRDALVEIMSNRLVLPTSQASTPSLSSTASASEHAR